ncbi:hypothetical protein Tco_1358130, partial [Tanacetum coccineum]
MVVSVSTCTTEVKEKGDEVSPVELVLENQSSGDNTQDSRNNKGKGNKKAKKSKKNKASILSLTKMNEESKKRLSPSPTSPNILHSHTLDHNHLLQSPSPTGMFSHNQRSKLCELYKSMQNPLLKNCLDILNVDKDYKPKKFKRFHFQATFGLKSFLSLDNVGYVLVLCNKGLYEIQKLLDALHGALPKMSLIASDFNYLPDVKVPGISQLTYCYYSYDIFDDDQLFVQKDGCSTDYNSYLDANVLLLIHITIIQGTNLDVRDMLSSDHYVVVSLEKELEEKWIAAFSKSLLK